MHEDPDVDPHKPKPAYITWEEAQSLFTKRIAEDMALNPHEWLGNFPARVLIDELERRGITGIRFIGDTKNVRPN
jgi:hypothetical protein